MDKPTKGKNIFDQMLDTVTNRDEKAALEGSQTACGRGRTEGC